MNQAAFDFDAHRLARRTDPDTSHQAAARVREFQAGHIATILWALREFGPQSKDQIAARTRLTGTQVDRRLPEMRKLGLAEPTEATRESASGRPERIWTARA